MLKNTNNKKDCTLFLTKTILFILLFTFALLPIFIKYENVYKPGIIKTSTIILLIFIMAANIIISFLEKKDYDSKNKESKSLQSKIDTQIDQLENLQKKYNDLKIKLLTQKDILKLSAELDNYITDFVVYIIFDKTYKFEEINPASFGYDFHIPEKDLAFTEVLVTDNNLRSNKGLMLSYKIYDVEKGGNTVDGSLHGGFNRYVNNLESEIRIIPNTYTIRDINGARFSIILSPNLIDRVRRVVFTVNNWILIDNTVNSNKWEKIDDITKLGGWQNYGLEQKIFYRIKPEFSSDNPWNVDLFGKQLHKLR